MNENYKKELEEDILKETKKLEELKSHYHAFLEEQKNF